MACTRCGSNANQCACVVQGRSGINVTGNGSLNDPYQVSFTGADLAGNGLRWNASTRRLSVMLADGSLAFAPSGGLYVTGKGGDSGDSLGATAEELEKRGPNQDVVGGLHGAGYMIKPQDTRGSISYGVQRGLDLMHLPVRMLADGTPVVAADAKLDSEQMSGWGGHVQEQDIQRWRTIPTEPGLWTETEAVPPPADPTKDNRPEKGWFGYLEPNQMGLTSLAEAFDLVGQSCVLLLELRFPAFNDAGWDEPQPPDERIRGFLERTSTLIRRYGLMQSVVVVTRTPVVPTLGADTINVLDTFRDANVRVGPVFRTKAEADKYPPGPDWPQGWTWAVLGADLPRDTITPYTSADPTIHCLLDPISRQHEHVDLVKPSGALGSLSPDPEYVAGSIPSHPTSGGYTYRRMDSHYEYGTVQHGLLPPVVNRDNARGVNRLQMRRIWDNGVPTDGEVFIAHTTPVGTHRILLGQHCPIPNPTKYQLDFFIDVRSIGAVEKGPTFAELAFGVEKDVALNKLSDAPNQAGYVFQYEIRKDANGSGGTGKAARLWVYDPDNGGSRALIDEDMSSYSYEWKWFRVSVSSEGIVVEFMHRGTGNPVWTRASTEQIAKAHRGEYLYFSRNATQGSGATVPALSRFIVRPGTATPPPPAAL